MLISRRGLITGLGSILAAPAIVRASSIMPVKAWADRVVWTGDGITTNCVITAVCEYQGKWYEALLCDDGRALLIPDGVRGSKVGDRLLLTMAG
jgi:hypothetical protein